MRRSLVLLVAVILTACGSTVHQAAKPVIKPTTTVASSTTTSTTTIGTVPAGEFLVASPVTSPLQYSASPGGPPVGTFATLTWGSPTVGPVVSQSDGYVQIGLGIRPNGSTGWVPRASVTLALSAYEIVVSVSQHTLTLFQDGKSIYSAPVGVGEAQWPTPMGLTFVVSVVATPKNQVYIYGPTVIILGAHSNTLLDFDGGDGTVAIHGYPSDPGSTEGVASSHGCVRASPATISAIEKVPLGSPVDVVA